MGDLEWGNRGVMQGPVVVGDWDSKERPWPVMEQPLMHEVFLQRYMLAMAAGQVFEVMTAVDHAEKAWQGIRAIIKAETEVPQ